MFHAISVFQYCANTAYKHSGGAHAYTISLSERVKHEEMILQGKALK
jgi:hypothetical protein